MKKKFYHIITHKKDIFSDIKYDSFERLFDAVQVYDINPPFKIIGNDKVDYTSEFLSFIRMSNYKFLSISEISKVIPKKLQTIMNKLWKKEFKVNTDPICGSPFKFVRIKFIPVEDLKSIDCFMNFWEQNILTIARADGGNYLITIQTNTSDTKVFIVDADLSSQDIHKDLVAGWNSIGGFINNVKKYESNDV